MRERIQPQGTGGAVHGLGPMGAAIDSDHRQGSASNQGWMCST